MKSKSIQWIFRALTLLTMVAIFLFSSQSGKDSYQVSEKFSQWIGAEEADSSSVPITDDNDGGTTGQDAGYYTKTNYYVFGFLNTRKLAHMLIYFALGVFTYGSFFGDRRWAMTLLIDYLYACADEIHQHFVGRTGCFSDTLYDAAGILLAVLLCEFICRIIRKKKRQSVKD